MRVTGWGATDPGRKRDHNEDSFLCNDRLGLYAVADGMGGHLGGERASHMAIQILERCLASQSLDIAADESTPAAVAVDLGTHVAWQPRPDLESGQGRGGDAGGGHHPPKSPVPELTSSSTATPLSTADGLRGAIAEADRSIYDSSLADPAFQGMGTTLTAILFANQRAYVGHVGDSRAYRARDGGFEQLTEDHSWIQDQVRAGILSAQEARESRFRNIITRSVGFEPAVRPDIQDLEVLRGDRFVICSDGLSNHLSTEEIGKVVAGHPSPDIPAVLVAEANARGGDDNITCICIEITD